MVDVITLNDQVHPVGASAKTTKIDMNVCIKVLKNQPPNGIEGILRALSYTTKHLNDDTASESIKSMLQYELWSKPGLQMEHRVPWRPKGSL